MNILVLASAVPYPPHGGGRQRVFAILRYLARDHTVDLVTLASPVEAVHRAALERVCRSVTFLPFATRRPAAARWARAVKSAVLLQAYEVDPRVRRAVLRLSHGYDLVQVENGHMIPYAATLTGVPKILDVFGLATGSVWHEARVQERWVDRVRVFLGRAKARRVERRLSEIFDAACVVSEPERRRLAALDPRLETRLVPNGVDVDRFVPVPEPVTSRVRLVFTGAMDYQANEDAVLFFCRDIYPRILDRLPGAEFWIVGRDPGSRVRALARDARIRVTGTIDDVQPFLGDARVVVVPMRMGSGTRIKILEALAMARPVVSTANGAEGLSVVSGVHLAIADAPQAFADEVVRLASDPAARQRLGRQGRSLVERAYAWPVALEPLGKAVQEVGARQRCRRSAS